MDTLKFRAWHKSTNTMVYFNPSENPNDEYQALHLWRLIGGIHEEGENLLMQSTGLTDKNGVEIFCDDILQTNDSYSVRKHQVIWGGRDYPAFDLMPNMDGSCNNLSLAFAEGWEVEVIGNIHANADLLNDPN
ncbi:MAG TPA: YopX family protein [Aquirhabdus sp.]